ncbi:MAG: TRAP transporter small permease subunit [Alphaproteobacteria bacterium]|nr:TRAP transporter small permease subunit [Alphaproteobacteria bacterium]
MDGQIAGRSAIGRIVDRLDRFLGACGSTFLVLANICLAVMLIGTSATIILRPFGISFYWIWPWTMVFFVWMTFFGLFAVYRLKKDIAVDFVVLHIGPWAMAATRYFVALVIIAVMGVILWQMPVIIEAQVGPVEGAILPGDTEIERYTLSIPLAISCALILLESVLEICKALRGVPETIPSHLTDPEG